MATTQDVWQIAYEQSPATLGYLAGIVDGEGCIVARIDGRGHLVLRLEIANTSETLMEWLVETFGGRANPRMREMQRTCFTWSVGTGRAVPILTAIAPYMKIKRRQAELFLEIARIADESRRAGSNALAEGRGDRRDAIIVELAELRRVA